MTFAIACRTGLSVAFLLSGAVMALADDASCATIRLSDPGWTDITATNAVASVVLTGLGYAPEVKTLSVPIGYASMKTGEIDVFLGNWMPAQQKFIDDLTAAEAVDHLAQNLTGAKFTLAVPSAAAAKGVTDFADLAAHGAEFDHKIYGIEPGAPANANIQKMIDSNDFGLKDWQLVDSGEQAMLAQVDRAVTEGKGIVFLAWAPHPMNATFDLTYLSGGDAYFGPDFGGATVHTLARKGWAGACPNAGKLFSNLVFDLGMENELMGSILGGVEPKLAAADWIKAHPEVLGPWLEGVTTLEGQPGEAAVKAALGL
ncbi:choline ABC transporter substrate-binding protein [Rhodobacter capsulatus]|uniref:choline ABC transporter substrate-binding protein n=1 Tax=Rhodobacter capsulatus TaxID=1061 RepID=UPI000A8F92FE|nr:choline ABC transporter substrate-binding protein [Rhodobacter capsulatus]PZX22320.1 glycine betaine/proline transport system substrate-binding protein [Rhodobacter capsulatus]QNR63032.1 choline ABC transporter substrate-binding protein [Rhodobacter capsulatus]